MKLRPTGRSMAAVSASDGASGHPATSAASCCRRPAPARSGAPRGQQHRGAALGDLADALERLGARAEQRPELGGQPRIVERLPGHREDPPQRLVWQERREDQVDEAALVALPAPMVEPSRPFGIKSLVAAPERAVVRLERRELLPHPEFGAVPEPGEIPGERRRASCQHVPEGRLERLALGELVVDRASLVFERRDGRRPLIRHHHRVPVLQHRGQHRDRRQDPGHRHVPVEEAEFGRAQQLRVDLPFRADHREPGHRGRLLDRVEPVGGPAHHEQRRVRQPADSLHRDDRVDPAAERHQRPLPQGGSGDGSPQERGVGGRPPGLAERASRCRRGQVQGVTVGELAQALEVELAEEAEFGLGQRGLAEVDHRRRRGLVVRDARRAGTPAAPPPGPPRCASAARPAA